MHWRRSRRHRAGLTILEVLVLLVLALVAVGLLLVGLRVSRERSQRLSCAYNLKQIGEGVLVFQSARANSFLPPSRIADRYATWTVEIAPYLPLKNHENPLKDWDLQKSYYSQPAAVRTAPLSLYFCPARHRPTLTSTSGDVPADGRPDREHYPGALGDYACAAGDGDPAHPWQTAANGAMVPAEVVRREGDLVLEWRGRVALETLPRGQAYTILIGEKHVPLGDFGRADQGDGSLYNGDHPASSARVGGPGHGLARSPTDPFQDNFGSYHPGICQFLYADGHVQPLADTMSEDVLGSLMRLQ
jgi:prepilin-type processing-associated H-X9-DG protein